MRGGLLRKLMKPVSNFYRRPLPKSCISFSSTEGKLLFKEALLNSRLEGYFKLASQFRTQDEPAFCGLATLVMTLNALEIDPGRIWKGPWRWYHEEMLDCCIPIDNIRQNGITYDQFVCIARCNGLIVKDKRYSEKESIDEFRHICDTITQQDDKVLITSYSRKGLNQTGDGHFAPIGGYHSGKDMVLLFDTARFKYPPHWISVNTLWKSMSMVDKVTGLPRGYLELSRDTDSSCLLLLNPSINLTEYLLSSNSKEHKFITEQSKMFEKVLNTWNIWQNENVLSKDAEQLWISGCETLFKFYLEFKEGESVDCAVVPTFPLTCSWNFNNVDQLEDLKTTLTSIVDEVVNSSVGKTVQHYLTTVSSENLEWLLKKVFLIRQFPNNSFLSFKDDSVMITFLMTSWILASSLSDYKKPGELLLGMENYENVVNIDVAQKVSVKKVTFERSFAVLSEFSYQTRVEIVQLSNKLRKMMNCHKGVDCCSNSCGTACHD